MAVEPGVDGVEPPKDLALELLEDGEGEGLIRHGEILLLSIEDRVSDVATIGDEGRKGRERPAAPMLAERGEAPGPFESEDLFRVNPKWRMLAAPRGGRLMRTDRIRCDFPLIYPEHQTLQFHTDDFGRKNRDMTLTSHGRLIWHGFVSPIRPEQPTRDLDLGLDGNFVMYAEPEGGGPLVHYRVFLDHGQVTWVRPCNRLGQMGAKRFLPTYRRR
jgi:hypothetical protein